MKTLVHPVTLASLALLVVNDHVLKAWWPGVVTGKLSDVAGMILAPIVLAAVVEKITKRRAPWTCAIVVALAFALAKTWAPATRAYEVLLETAHAPLRFFVVHALSRPAFTEHVVLVRDPTDLVAIPFCAIAIAIMVSPSGRRPDSRLRPDSG